jgi:hypothetical protein
MHHSPYYHTIGVVPYYTGATKGTYIIYEYRPPQRRHEPVK